MKNVTGTFKDPRDGRIYKTVKIGNKIWMAENLALKVNSGCWTYKDDESNANKYGYLYDLQTALKVCPTGWKLPSESDFEALLNSFEDEADAYEALIIGGKSGFSALLGGARDSQGNYGFEGEYSFFGTSTKFGSWKTQWIRMSLCKNSSEARMGNNPAEWGFSVRCMQEK